MKKLIVLFFAPVLFWPVLFCQYSIQIGSPHTAGPDMPVNNQYDYNWSSSLYHQDEIQVHGDITKLFYNATIWGQAGHWQEPLFHQRIFMKLTDEEELTSLAFPDTNSMTLVFSGMVTWENTGLSEIVLDAPFSYDNKKNLQILYINKSKDKVAGMDGSFFCFYDNNAAVNRTVYNAADTVFPVGDGTLTKHFPVTYFSFSPGLDAGISSINNNINEILAGPNDLSVRFRNYMADTITALDIHWEWNGIEQTSVPWTGELFPGKESEAITLLNDFDIAPGTYSLKAWTSQPNGGVDELAENDTLMMSIRSGYYIEIRGNYVENNVPYDAAINYGWSSSIYLRDSINARGKISGIAYPVSWYGRLSQQQKICLSSTPEARFYSGSMPDQANMNLMFEGSIEYPNSGWHTIDFDTVFNYDGVQNIQLFYQNYSNIVSSRSINFLKHNRAGASIYNHSTDAFPLTDGTVYDAAPGIRFYFLLLNDAGIARINAPAIAVHEGNHEIKVALRNYGMDTLTSTTIHYQIDSGSVKTYSWSGAIASEEEVSDLVIGSEDFAYGQYRLKVWTSAPNGYDDYVGDNDTAAITFFAGSPLSGTYTVGEAPSDFLTVKEAVDSLNAPSGINGPVVFEIKPGIYSDQYILNQVYGSNAAYSVTFRSQTGDSTDVVITSDSTDFIFRLNGADHVFLERLTFASDSALTFLEITNSSSNNSFIGNRFEGSERTENLIVSPSVAASFDTANLFLGNFFLGGANGLTLRSPWNVYKSGNGICNNAFYNQTSLSIMMKFQEDFVIRGNTIANESAKAIECVNLRRMQCTGNSFHSGATHMSPVRFAFNTDTSLIANNFFSCYTTDLRGDNYIFVNNTLVGSRSSGSYSVLKSEGDDMLIVNNVIVNKGVGAAVNHYFSGANTSIFDHNCLYVRKGEPVGVWRWLVYCATLEEWQTVSGMDSNSIFMLPTFASETDLHTNSLALDGAGVPLEFITDDIDGDTRDAANPDIGADEFTSTCPGMLKGNYTIGASGDFSSFGEALTALYDCGVDSTVVFSVQDGTYEEQIKILPGIPGYTENDSIIFQSQSLDSSALTLSWEADSATNYTLKLKGAERFIFKHLQLVATDSVYANVLTLEGGAVNNRFENCIMRGVSSQDNDKRKALVHFVEDNILRDTGNVFVQNTFLQGSYGLLIEGNDNADETGNSIVGNQFKNQTAQAIAATYQLGLVIKNNEIVNNNPVAFDFVALSNHYADSAFIIGNRMVIERNANVKGISLNNYRNYNVIANNSMSIKSNNGKAEAIINPGKYTEIYYNTVYLMANIPSTAIDVSHNTKFVEIRNNIIANHTGGLVFRCSFDNSQLAACEYNVFYTTGEDIVHWWNVDYQSLSKWEAVSGFGGSSYAVYPEFTSFTDLTTSNVLCNNTATPIAYIPDDIQGNVRDAATPDMGAVEFDGEVSFSLGEDVSLCAEDNYRINAGEGFYSYAWSTGADTAVIWVDTTGVGSGTRTYAVTVTLGAEEYADSLAVTLVSPVATPVTDYCFNSDLDSIEISAGDAASYKWNTNDTTQSIFIKTGNWFYVTVTDDRGCQDNGEMHVHYNYCLAEILADTNIIELHDSLVLTANACWEDYRGYDYLWNTSDTSHQITLKGADLGVGAHYFSVEIINRYKNNCYSTDSIGISVMNSNSVEETMTLHRVNIYPNPVKKSLHIDFNDEKNISRNIRLIRIDGVPVLSKNIAGQQAIISVEALDSGMYFVLIEQEGKRFYYKIVVLE